VVFEKAADGKISLGTWHSFIAFHSKAWTPPFGGQHAASGYLDPQHRKNFTRMVARLNTVRATWVPSARHLASRA